MSQLDSINNNFKNNFIDILGKQMIFMEKVNDNLNRISNKIDDLEKTWEKRWIIHIGNKYSLKDKKQEYPNYGKKWEKEDIDNIISLFNRGIEITDISKVMKRPEKSIENILEKNNIIEIFYE